MSGKILPSKDPEIAPKINFRVGIWQKDHFLKGKYAIFCYDKEFSNQFWVGWGIAPLSTVG